MVAIHRHYSAYKKSVIDQTSSTNRKYQSTSTTSTLPVDQRFTKTRATCVETSALPPIFSTSPDGGTKRVSTSTVTMKVFLTMTDTAPVMSPVTTIMPGQSEFVSVVKVNNTNISTSPILIGYSPRPTQMQDTLPELPSFPVGVPAFVTYFTLFVVLASLLLVCVYRATIPRRRSRKWNTLLRTFCFRRSKKSSSDWKYRKMQHSPNSSSPTRFGVSSGFRTPNSAAFTSSVATPMTASFPPNSPWLAAGLSQRSSTHSELLSLCTPPNAGINEESLTAPSSLRSRTLFDSTHEPDNGRWVHWGFGSLVSAVTEKIVRWTADAGDEGGLLLPITESERKGEVEF